MYNILVILLNTILDWVILCSFVRTLLVQFSCPWCIGNCTPCFNLTEVLRIFRFLDNNNIIICVYQFIYCSTVHNYFLYAFSSDSLRMCTLLMSFTLPVLSLFSNNVDVDSNAGWQLLWASCWTLFLLKLLTILLSKAFRFSTIAVNAAIRTSNPVYVLELHQFI